MLICAAAATSKRRCDGRRKTASTTTNTCAATWQNIRRGNVKNLHWPGDPRCRSPRHVPGGAVAWPRQRYGEPVVGQGCSDGGCDPRTCLLATFKRPLKIPRKPGVISGAIAACSLFRAGGYTDLIGCCLSAHDRVARNHPRYLSLEVLSVCQARNAASACSRSSALLSRRGGCLFAGVVTTGIAPLISSTPRRRRIKRRRCSIAFQFVRPLMTPIDCNHHSKAAGDHAEKPAALP